MVFLKTANEILNDFDFIVRNGIQALREGMAKARRFDPTNPFPNYDEKNEYFNHANEICQFSLWGIGLNDLCERYYAILLREIKQYEITNTTNLNKGMAYANLGVSQVAQGKIDEGFANILKAHIEDEPYHRTNPARSIFNLKLYSQFEDDKIGGREGTKDYILKRAQLYQTEETVTFNLTNLSSFISNLSTDSHIMLVSVIEKIRRNLEALSDMDNRFSRVQTLACLQDLCLVIESELKTKNTITNGELKNILDDLFSTRRLAVRPPWKAIFDANYPTLCKAHTILELKNNLEQILTTITDNKAKRMSILCLMRNFCAHNLDVGNDYVFGKIKDNTVLDNLISAMLFLHNATYL